MLAELRRLVAGRPAPADTEQRVAGLPTTEHGLPLPFVCQRPDGSGTVHDVRRARVTQCALSRICGVCSRPLGRPVAFVGTPLEVGRNAFHAPPLHTSCVPDLKALPYADASWEVVTTSGFEFVRQNADAVDRRPVFSPNSVIEETRVPADQPS